MNLSHRDGKCPECVKSGLKSIVRLTESRQQNYGGDRGGYNRHEGDRESVPDQFCDENGNFHDHTSTGSMNYSWECDHGHAGRTKRYQLTCPYGPCNVNKLSLKVE